MRKQINRLFATMLGAAACLAFAGCVSRQVSDPGDTEPTVIVGANEDLPEGGGSTEDEPDVDGGLILDGGLTGGISGEVAAIGSELPKNVQKMFEIATVDWTGDELTPINLLGSKIVAGTIYELLCIEKQSEKGGAERLVLADLYAGFDGTYSLSSVRAFDSLNLKEKEQTDGMILSGSFTVTDAELSVAMPPAVQIAVKKAQAGLEDTEVEIMTYLGSQVVAGMKYRFLCRAVKKSEGAEPGLYYAAIYEDLGGNASFVDLYEIELP